MARNGGGQKNKTSIRPMIFAVAGTYELYITGRLVIATVKGDSGLSQSTSILLSVLMGLLGVGIIFYSWRLYKAEKRLAEQEAAAEAAAEAAENALESAEEAAEETAEETEPETEETCALPEAEPAEESGAAEEADGKDEG